MKPGLIQSNSVAPVVGVVGVVPVIGVVGVVPVVGVVGVVPVVGVVGVHPFFVRKYNFEADACKLSPNRCQLDQERHLVFGLIGLSRQKHFEKS